MPGGDGTGPMGYGRLTGRGAGYCAGFGASESVNPVEVGYGSGRGRRLEGCFMGFLCRDVHTSGTHMLNQ